MSPDDCVLRGGGGGALRLGTVTGVGGRGLSGSGCVTFALLLRGVAGLRCKQTVSRECMCMVSHSSQKSIKMTHL